jgi:hypothetical protein
LARRSDESGVPDTCKIIDAAISEIESCECGECNSYVAKQSLEKVRDYNSKLRTWGNDQYEKVQQLEQAYEDAMQGIEDLREQIKELKQELSD